MLVHNAKAFHAIEPECTQYVRRADFIDYLNKFHERYEAEVGVDAEFRDDLSLSLPLLWTCRQIYHEGAGVLYGCNTFVITRALDRHDNDVDGLHYDETEDWAHYCQLSYVSTWLSCLGSQAALLRNVLIGVDAMCPLDCDYTDVPSDILPMLRFLWFHAHNECSLAFAHTHRKLSVHKSDGTTSSSSTCVKATAYNNMLHKLVVDDVLCLKRFARSKRILSEVVVSIREGEGFIRYWRTTGTPYIQEEVEILDEGQTVRRKHALTVSNHFERLSWHILHRIVELTVAMSSARNEIVFNLDNRRVRGLPMNILHANERFRYQNTTIGRLTSVILEASAENIIANSDNFTALKELMPDGEPVNATWSFRTIALHASYSKQLAIALHLKPDVPAILDEVRIDIKGLLNHSGHQALGKHTSVCITLWHPNGAGTISSTTVAFNELLKRVFLVLSDMMIQWPEDLPQAIGRQLPHIIIDGNGTILNATYPAGPASDCFCVQNRHAQLRPKEVEIAAYRMTTAVANTYLQRTGRKNQQAPLSLCATWKSLRKMYWPYFENRRPEQDL